MMLPAFEAFHAHAQVESPREACGLIVRLPQGEETYWEAANVHPEPETQFQIREEDWAAAEDQGEILAVCHSHPRSSPAPGPADLDGVQEHGLPWYILGAGAALQRIDPTMRPLEARPFVYGWTDCYSLVRDWFLAHRQTRLPDFPREENFWDQGHSPYLDHFKAFGFHQVERQDLQPGDALLMKIQANVPNHAGIYVGQGRVLHHLWGRLSARDLYTGGLQAATTHVLRYQG